MNNQLQQFARDTLKSNMAQLSESHHIMFKRMYSHKNLDANINDVIDKMPEDKLDWAMQQAQGSICIKKEKCMEAKRRQT